MQNLKAAGSWSWPLTSI